ncbi:MAG: UTP--glucose-1-phosphate uridylyltransferase [Clostridia bacterium]|nr:UTP--glucose-1-phosphate uridylyltransferase [Clostridia bacterium]
MSKVRKAVIPVAGYGTRFLPYTKAVPKAMLPIINKPAIQIITEEVINSGITDVLFIVGYKHEVIEAHFAKSHELDSVLLEKSKRDLYDAIKYPETMARISFATQKELNGTAKAIETAKNFVNSEPFAILFGDDVMYNKEYPVIKQLIDVFDKTGKTVVGCKNVPRKDVPMYASVEYDGVESNVYNATRIIEKPKLEDVKSTVSPLGRYVVTPDIFDIISNLTPGANGEYQFTDALDIMAKNGNCKALVFDGVRYDMGSRLGYLKANIEFGLRDNEISNELKQYLKNLLEEYN